MSSLPAFAEQIPEGCFLSKSTGAIFCKQATASASELSKKSAKKGKKEKLETQVDQTQPATQSEQKPTDKKVARKNKEKGTGKGKDPIQAASSQKTSKEKVADGCSKNPAQVDKYFKSIFGVGYGHFNGFRSMIGPLDISNQFLTNGALFVKATFVKTEKNASIYDWFKVESVTVPVEVCKKNGSLIATLDNSKATAKGFKIDDDVARQKIMAFAQGSNSKSVIEIKRVNNEAVFSKDEKPLSTVAIQ